MRPILAATLPLLPVPVDERNKLGDEEPITAEERNSIHEVVLSLLDDLHVDRLALQRVVLAELLDDHDDNDDEARELHDDPV